MTGCENVKPRRKSENLWLNLLFNAVIPAVILSWFARRTLLGPKAGLVVALLFPFGYGLYDILKRKTLNSLSVVGFVSTLLTGGLGLMEMNGFWFAFKEAALPVVVGLAIPLSLRTRQPLVRTLLYNDQVLNTDRIQNALEMRGKEPEFERLLAWASWWLAVPFVVSGTANFLLALWLLPAESGTEQFARQLGKLQLWTWPTTVVPAGAAVFYILFTMLKGIERMTGLRGEELFHPAHAKSRARETNGTGRG
ncbi:MAG: MFS transporter [Verrucomicrobia bacterium]|nr:MFS transporter [Verrucomicrobiota bacterium]